LKEEHDDITSTTTTETPTGEGARSPDEAQLAAAAFLARYRGRTLEAYQYDLRSFFEWADDHSLDVLAATRAHLEWYRTALEQRGLAAATIDRRLCTVCGYYRFAHLDGRITANPPSMSVAPRCSRQRAAGWTEASWLGSCSPPSSTITRMLAWPCCWG
jgi:hypothetical protein